MSISERIESLQAQAKEFGRTHGYERFHHVGLIVPAPDSDAVFVESTQCWVSPVRDQVETLYFESGSPCHVTLRTLPHFCFAVDRLEDHIGSLPILLPIFQGAWGRAVFVEIDGRPIEFLEALSEQEG